MKALNAYLCLASNYQSQSFSEIRLLFFHDVLVYVAQHLQLTTCRFFSCDEY